MQAIDIANLNKKLANNIIQNVKIIENTFLKTEKVGEFLTNALSCRMHCTYLNFELLFLLIYNACTVFNITKVLLKRKTKKNLNLSRLFELRNHKEYESRIK